MYAKEAPGDGIPDNNETAIQAIINPQNKWEFISDHNRSWVKFHENGKIECGAGLCETNWAIEGGFLVIKTAKNEVTTVFRHEMKDFYGKWHLDGRFQLNRDGYRNYIVQI